MHDRTSTSSTAERCSLPIPPYSLATRLAIGWMVLAAVAGLLIAANLNNGFYVRGAITAAHILITVLVTLATLYLTRPATASPSSIAARIEARFPELESRLLTAMEQRLQLPGDRFGYLQHNVIQEAVVHGYRHDWRNIVSSWRYGLTHLVCLLALAALITSTIGLFRYIQAFGAALGFNCSLPIAERPARRRNAGGSSQVTPKSSGAQACWYSLVSPVGLPKEVSLIVTEDDQSAGS